MATMRQVEMMIKEVRAADEMISFITSSPNFTTPNSISLTTRGTRDAMIGGLIERKQNLLDALGKLGIVDEVA